MRSPGNWIVYLRKPVNWNIVASINFTCIRTAKKNLILLKKKTNDAELKTAHARTDISFSRLQGALLHPFLLLVQLLAVLSLPDLPHVLHDGGIAADRLAILLAGHLQTDPHFLHMQKENYDLPLNKHSLFI